MASVKSLTIGGKTIFDLFYPVGSIYETSNASFNPNTSFGGTWERIKGKVIVGVDENDTDFSSSKNTGGEKAHKLTKDELPHHNHALLGGSHSFTWGDSRCTVNTNATAVANHPSANTLCTLQGTMDKTDANATNEAAHNNMPPYYTVYIWERIS